MGVGCTHTLAVVGVVYTFFSQDPDNDDKKMTKILTGSDLGEWQKTGFLRGESMSTRKNTSYTPLPLLGIRSEIYSGSEQNPSPDRYAVKAQLRRGFRGCQDLDAMSCPDVTRDPH
jgi:hypothetical protein